jgi:hypothetical protein
MEGSRQSAAESAQDAGELLAYVRAGVIIRHSARLQSTIDGYRELADLRIPGTDRELLEDLFEVLNEEVTSLRKLALMIAPQGLPL